MVEDHEDSRRAIRRLLDANGYDVKAVASVKEALYVLERYGCDLLISDILLPDGTGIELMRTLAAGNGVPKAIAMTGSTSSDDQTACAKAGFTAFVPKPIMFTQLLKEVERVLAH